MHRHRVLQSLDEEVVGEGPTDCCVCGIWSFRRILRRLVLLVLCEGPQQLEVALEEITHNVVDGLAGRGAFRFVLPNNFGNPFTLQPLNVLKGFVVTAFFVFGLTTFGLWEAFGCYWLVRSLTALTLNKSVRVVLQKVQVVA